MTDIFSFVIIRGLATFVVYPMHTIKEMRVELGIRQRVTLLEETVFGNIDDLPPADTAERRKRARKVEP